MKSFAFIVNPITTKQLKLMWPGIRAIPDFMIGFLSKRLPPYKALLIKGIKSRQGENIDGFIIVCPLLPSQVSGLGEELILDRIISAGRLGQKLGAGIIGLDCFAALMADKEYDTIANNLKISVTGGHSLTAWSMFEGAYRLAKARKMDLKNSSVALYGLGSSALSLCARKLSDVFGKIILFDRQAERPEKLKELILSHASVEVVIEQDPRNAVKDADIVIQSACLAEAGARVDLQNLKPNAVFCHVPSLYDYFAGSGLRKDITFARLGLIKLPVQDRLGAYMGLPKGIVYASMAETMLLALEEKLVNYSLGDSMNMDKLEEIADMAVRHGFEVWVPEAPVM